MKTSIVYLGNFPPKEGRYSAGDRRIEALTTGLNKANQSTNLIVPIEHFNESENQQFSKFEIIPIGNLKIRSFLLRRIYFWLSLIKYVKKSNTLTVIFYGPSLESLIAILPLKIRKTKLVLEICDLFSGSKKGLKGLYFSLSESIIPNFMDQIISISSTIDKSMKKFAPNTPLLRVPVLVEKEEFDLNDVKYSVFTNQYDIKKEDSIIFYMGGLWKNEGIELLLESFKEFYEKNANSNSKLFITGRFVPNNSNYVDVEKFSKENKLENRIIYLGFIHDDLLKMVLKRADVVTLTQTQCKFNEAGLPTKSAEYAMAGKAIIATKVGDMEKYFTHLNNIYYIENQNDIIEAFRILLINDKSLKVKLGENAKTTALNYFDNKTNGSKIAESLEAI